MSMTETTSRDREFELGDEEFAFLRELVKDKTGINLSPAKRELVYGRLARRLRALGLKDFGSYCEILRENRDNELGHMVNAITTNLTMFFRENHHFEYLADQLMPRLFDAARGTKRIRIWSAGCSTGEEAYSIAMVVRECMPSGGGWDVKILATDLDTTVLARARSGEYPEERLNVLPRPERKRWFAPGAEPGTVQMDPRLKSLITFKPLNLMGPWPVKGPFDAIFCRNVIIYFDKETQKTLVERFASVLGHEGHLFLGHSESLYKVSERFHLLGNTIYRKAV